MQTVLNVVLSRSDVLQLRIDQFMALENGAVVLVRSTGVPELGDHFVVVTGPPVQKKHGCRPQTLTIHANVNSGLIDQYTPSEGAVLLMLTAPAAAKFRFNHGIAVIHGEVVFPKNLIVNEILRIFEGFRLPPTQIDQYNEVGREKLYKRLMGFVIANQPIKFSMLGYPFKSGNTRDKVLGYLPDLGEEKSLENFSYMADLVKQVYTPGVEFSIISDGYVFSDVFGVPETNVLAYNEYVKALAKGYPIAFYDALDFYKEEPYLYNIREKITTQWGVTPEVLEKRILTDMNVNTLYRGMIIFMTEENAMKDYPSRSQREKDAKRLARQAMFRNEAYSALVQHEFSDHIRLSMHNSTNDGTKYSIQLVQGIYKFSPWHSCLVVHDGGIVETIHRKDGIQAGFELVNKDGRPYYFVDTKKREEELV